MGIRQAMAGADGIGANPNSNAEASVPASSSEESLHSAAIEALALEMHRPISEIKPHYDREMRRLRDGARVHEFLSVCAARHTREALRSSSR